MDIHGNMRCTLTGGKMSTFRTHIFLSLEIAHKWFYICTDWMICSDCELGREREIQLHCGRKWKEKKRRKKFFCCLPFACCGGNRIQQMRCFVVIAYQQPNSSWWS